jgi:hypothetical protein
MAADSTRGDSGCEEKSRAIDPAFLLCDGIAHFAEGKPVNAMTLFEFSRP